MLTDFFEKIIIVINIFDISVIFIFIYCVVQCFFKGFSLSLISFMKWVISTVVTIIMVPKLQPTVSDYIESQFINNVGLGIGIFIGRAVKWTGVGSIDKIFGLIFGFFKGYIVSVCIFSILNWFYPYKNWGISVEDAVSFNLINKGSEILVKEFPSSEDFKDTKEKIEKI